MEFRNGMNELYTPSPGIQPAANIVFIHGLFGGPWKTFAATYRKRRKATTRDNASSQYSPVTSMTSSRGPKAPAVIYWPQDLLPKSIQNANVFSFGYDANVERFMSATGGNTVHHHGRNLLNSLRDLLKEHGPLPLLIVVHSLGGLVVKEALNQSAHSSDVELSRVLQMTHGVIFLGTPHRGSSAATYGRVAFWLTKIFALQNANTNLISSLERDSDMLDRISTAFIETLAKAECLKLWSFAEEKQIRWGIIGMHIVPPESAKIGHERENWGTISGDHRQIAKYLEATDEGFVKVSSVLKGWIDDALFTVTEEDRHLYGDCLKSLDGPEARRRIGEVSQVSRVNKGSFEWFFKDERVAYTEWLADDDSVYDPIFWITGKPGSGKSTLMRFALEDPRSESLLPPSVGHPMAYFFHLRGKSLVQKSLQGMMQELLFQTLKQFPDFFVALKPIYERIVSKKGVSAEWDLEDLMEGFSLIPDLAASSIEGRPRIFLFIDALDENQGQKNNEKLVRVLKDIVRKYQVRKAQPGTPLLKICLASRPWPLFHLAFGEQPRIPSIAVNEFTLADIKAYTQSLLLKPLSGTQYPERYQQSVLDLAGRITALAQGVFVWVRVVVDRLCQHIVDGTPIDLLDGIVMGYPRELDELYEHTIRRIPKEYRRETEVALKVVLQSRIQLKLGELYTICLICIGSAVPGEIELLDVPASWLASRCGGLIDTTSRTEDRAHQTDAEVQFIHQTVEDFVRHGINGLSEEPSTDLPLGISGSQFLAFTCLSAQTHSQLKRVYDDVYSYLRDIEQAMDLASLAQYYYGSKLVSMFPKSERVISRELERDFQTNPPQGAFNLRAHHLSSYDELFHSDRPEAGSRLPTMYWATRCTPIWHDLYYFGTGPLKSKSSVEYAASAALGPRSSSGRTDRPRMLSKVLFYLPNTRVDDSIQFFSEFPRDGFCCEFVPNLVLHPRNFSLKLVTLLVSAIPNEKIDDEALLKMTEMLLAFGASTSELIYVNSKGPVCVISLLNFVVRFKEGRREAWIGLLRRNGARLYDYEFTWTNQRALSASLSDKNLTVNEIWPEEEESVSSATVIIGLCLGNGMLRNQLLTRACFDARKVPRQSYQEDRSSTDQRDAEV
ncbi:hypothetical protein F4824DRAFT_474266 [Ustulina deusta]|nr:hypothetical protein F4824DRAFT_474266 [Ustulina deusta]